jgi:hypothetical protein
MNRKSIILSATLALLLVGMAFFALPAMAGDRVSRGEALSLLHGWNNARRAILLNDGVGAVQFEDFTNTAILPFGNFEGKHYCEEDHQVAMMGWISSATTYEEAKASLDTVTQAFLIDGQQYETIRTPVVQRVGTSPGQQVFAFSEGAILAPGDLSVGMHTLEAPIYFSGDLILTLDITFHMDAAGTGVCQ